MSIAQIQHSDGNKIDPALSSVGGESMISQTVCSLRRRAGEEVITTVTTKFFAQEEQPGHRTSDTDLWIYALLDSE